MGIGIRSRGSALHLLLSEEVSMATAVQEFRQEEKSVLAKELGLTTLQSHYAQVQELTGLKFPRITRA